MAWLRIEIRVWRSRLAWRLLLPAEEAAVSPAERRLAVEWRQWRPEAGALENPPLFQTVATEALNQPGELRDDFLAFVCHRSARCSRCLRTDRYLTAGGPDSPLPPWHTGVGGGAHDGPDIGQLL